jgi:hypothetical protein
LRATGKYLLYTNFPSRRVGILFWLRDSHFYPYEAPGGAETFWSFTFLSIRSPWRGRGVLEFHISIHTKPLAGQRRFGDSHFYPYEAPGGAEAFWSFTFLSIRSPWRGRGVLEFHIISTNMTLRQVGVINPPSVEFRVKSVESVELSLFRLIILQTAIGTITTLHPNIKK